ncbi:MmcQ/YjbR family DNA-binding protein [Phytohabitans sp. ZYX-F-186]|uniref:MmcQ/YjbR family DNA-binding protein n=1 Tax=Phytohabitans maris TaxID=3071409 RepID=A0ABU0ZTQ9_9ACTN|nr:MmcQ/YjbR family DNA-binding protein [Phytohabitans sp. ZYX-F-186]MDQ7909684.1 MmcQ/YjbR family DNA-binding protein [Phytohabitans sp. ZYX-F-186]
MVTADDVRRVALSLPRAYEALVRDRVKFRVGQIVFVALSRDETEMGFGYPKEERAALIAAEPDKFFMPIKSDERYNWVRVWLAKLDEDEMRELVVDAWRMCVPKKVIAEYEASPR